MAEKLQFRCMWEGEGIEDLEREAAWNETKGSYGRKHRKTSWGKGTFGILQTSTLPQHRL